MTENQELLELKAERLDQLFDELSRLVSGTGPKLLTRGMDAIEANEAILACVEDLTKIRMVLIEKVQVANEIIDLLPCFSQGMSFLAEERVKALIERYDEVGRGISDRSNSKGHPPGV